MRVLWLVPLAMSLGGCIVGTAVDVVTLPVKAASKTVDVLTTSQSEADEKRGREIRKQEEREGKARRKAEREARRRAERDES
jgi:hypothetical protein